MAQTPEGKRAVLLAAAFPRPTPTSPLNGAPADITKEIKNPTGWMCRVRWQFPDERTYPVKVKYGNRATLAGASEVLVNDKLQTTVFIPSSWGDGHIYWQVVPVANPNRRSTTQNFTLPTWASTPPGNGGGITPPPQPTIPFPVILSPKDGAIGVDCGLEMVNVYQGVQIKLEAQYPVSRHLIEFFASDRVGSAPIAVSNFVGTSYIHRRAVPLQHVFFRVANVYNSVTNWSDISDFTVEGWPVIGLSSRVISVKPFKALLSAKEVLGAAKYDVEVEQQNRFVPGQWLRIHAFPVLKPAAEVSLPDLATRYRFRFRAFGPDGQSQGPWSAWAYVLLPYVPR